MVGGLMSSKYKDFTLSLALFDALPVMFFCVLVISIANSFHSALFAVGATLCCMAGIGKVVWKIIVAEKGKDIKLLNKQMRLIMPTGFLLIIAGLIISRKTLNPSLFFAAVMKPTNLIFFVIAILGMVMMGIFAFTLDSGKAKSNCIEQITNAIAQCSLMIGIILSLK